MLGEINIGIAFLTVVLVIATAVIAWLWFTLVAERRSAVPWRLGTAVIEQAEDAVVLVNSGGVITFANRAASDLVGHDVAQMVGSPVAEWINDEDRPLLEGSLSALHTAPPTDVAMIYGRIEHPALGERNIEANARNLLADTTVQAMMLTLRDVTANWELEEQLGRRAFWDPLTELPNRALFFDRIAHALGRPVTGSAATEIQADTAVILLIDIDDMQAINEGTDMLVGNRVLQTVADRIQAAVPEGASIARVGGDMFGVLLEAQNAEELGLELAQRLLGLIRLPMKLGDAAALTTSASIGIGHLSDGGTVASVLADADVAVHRAKRDGPSGLVVFDESFRNGAALQLRLRSELPSALHRGDLHVAYQAIFDTSSAGAGPAAPSGFEALVRWVHPEHGPISPIQFIPAAEAAGLIGELGQWVLAQACFQTARWNAAGDREFTISVNVSGLQLADSGFIDQVAATLKASGLPARLLILELTESVLIDSPDIVDALTRLRKLGLGLAIDDFGTGYSSLAYLQKFPVTRLKVDRSFTARLEDPAGKRLVYGILQLAEQLGLATVAEGVETEPQLAALGSMGCNYIQGFLLARPVPSEEIDPRFGVNGTDLGDHNGPAT